MRVWTYPENTYETFGAKRLELEWQEMTKAARKRQEQDPDYEWDYDRDICYVREVFKVEDREKALARAREIVDSGVTAFGSATIQEQAVDWYVEEDRIAEWVEVGEPEYVD